MVVVWLFFSHWSVAILNRDVLDNWLKVLLVEPSMAEVRGIVIWDKVSVAILIHHRHHLWLKRLNILDRELLLCHFGVLSHLLRLMDWSRLVSKRHDMVDDDWLWVVELMWVWALESVFRLWIWLSWRHSDQWLITLDMAAVMNGVSFVMSNVIGTVCLDHDWLIKQVVHAVVVRVMVAITVMIDKVVVLVSAAVCCWCNMRLSLLVSMLFREAFALFTDSTLISRLVTGLEFLRGTCRSMVRRGNWFGQLDNWLLWLDWCSNCNGLLGLHWFTD